MATRIRFARGGAKKRPFYRLVATDARSPRDGKFIEKLGTFNPLLADDNKEKFIFNKERIEYWLGTGASPSEKVAVLLWNEGIKSVEKYLPNAFPKSAAEREKLKKARLDAEKKKADEAKKKAEQEAADEAAANAPAEEAPAEEATDAPAEEAKAEEAPAENAEPKAEAS